ncbi:hemoblobin-interacting domain-containing protein [Paenibacillus planticolens]|uniref:DUF1533 domain-containing protein n=1 Tax=Paenibacillus planticolens TaxID=2654976 RepID=A0ABX1ZUH0_9BACL|nr:hemoblobin-interacting domain-containing protein [Paenibacillus planticolens]NOV02690.1 DUF1533 domain-containing protein [Paenibacillus planticolens]
MVSNDLKSKPSFMGIVSKVMAIVMTFMMVFTISPVEGYASPVTADPLTSATADVSNNNTTVTVTFNTYAAPTIDLADLKSNIQIKRSVSGSFVDLSADNGNNVIHMTTEGALVITLGAELTGTANAIKVKAGSIRNEDLVTSNADVTVSGIAAKDITPPAFTGAESRNGGDVYLSFDEDFSINAPVDADSEQIETFLKSNISVAADGVNFVPVSAHQGNFRQNGSRTIYLNFYNDMKVILGTNTIIKIASGTIKDSAGNANGEMNLPVSPPVILSTEISSDNHDVTITFNEAVVDRTEDSLRNRIYVIRGTNSEWKGLVAGDTVSINSAKLQIHFKEALSGANNQIVIGGGMIANRYGNVETADRLTALIQANVGGDYPIPADTTPPKYLYAYISNAQDLNIVFDEDVQNAYDTDAQFLQSVQWYRPNQWFNGLPSDATLTFSGHVATIHFATSLTGYPYYHFTFYPNHFKDTAGNVNTDYVYANWMNPQDTVLNLNNGYFSHNGRWMSLQFNSNTDLVDQTVVDGVSHLKEKITISTDHGSSYTALGALDVVMVQGNRITVFFHDAKKVGSVQIKITENVVSDLYDSKRNEALDEEVAYNTPDITGYVFSNVASDFIFEDNAEWRSKVKVVRVSDDDLETDRQLNLESNDYTLTEGKLTISNGVFQKGHYYYISVDAEGYSTKYFEGRAYQPSEIFYMTAPVVTAKNGITATINLVNNARNNNSTIGNQSVVFELFNGLTPISIVAANLRVDTGTYSANFNVSDAATNPNFKVKAYIVSKYSNDSTNLGVNLATVKTQLELDQAISKTESNNNN